jgi:hypothetical protein
MRICEPSHGALVRHSNLAIPPLSEIPAAPLIRGKLWIDDLKLPRTLYTSYSGSRYETLLAGVVSSCGEASE